MLFTYKPISIILTVKLLKSEPNTVRLKGKLAKFHHCDLSQLIAYAIEQLPAVEPPKDRLLGLFTDDPESVDEMLEEVMKDRAAHSMTTHPKC